MTEEVPPNQNDVGDEEIAEDEEEYNVEAIRGKRKNPKTGLLEYLIKWENYPESANTWEPVDNLKCPDLICRFHEQEKAKRKRKCVSESQAKRSRTSTSASTSQGPADALILAEDDLENGSGTETLSCTNEPSQQEYVEPVLQKPKGFDRGLQLESIISACTDDDDKLWFFVKWVGANDIELVEASEIEEKAPRDLCSWYRERMYYTIKTGNEKHLSRISPTNDQQIKIR